MRCPRFFAFPAGSSGGSGPTPVEQELIATGVNTLPALSQAPNLAYPVLLWKGVIQETQYYSVSGTNITWLGSTDIEAGELIKVVFFV